MFGNAQQQPQPGAGGGLFGGSNSTGGLFGTSTTQNQTGGGLFGASSQQPQHGGGLFSTSSQQPQQGGGLFGTSSQQPQQAGGLFGTSTQQQPQQQGGVFGSSFQGQPPASGGSLFSGTNTQSSAPAATGLFGSSTNPLLGGGGNSLFGGNKPTGSSFGQPASTTNVNSQPPLFGNLGQSQLPQQPQQAQPAQGSSFFGQSQAQQARPGGSLLGQSTNPVGSSLFGSTLAPSSLLSSASRPSIGPVSQQADPQSQFIALGQRIEGIAQSWNSNSPQCRFQHYFYNLVDPNQVHLYGRPQNATNETLWQKAVRENPDPSCLVPVIAIGFDDLNQRVQAQAQQAAGHQEKLKEFRTRIQTLSQRHEQSNASRLRRATQLQTQLTHRLLGLMQHLHLLIPAVRSSAIRPEEEALRSVLEEIEEDIRAGRLRGKLNELWALVGAVNATKERKMDSGMEWAVVDEDGLAQIIQILSEQQAGLAHLTKILQGDLKDLTVIQGGDTHDEDTDNAASTLRASYTLR